MSIGKINYKKILYRIEKIYSSFFSPITPSEGSPERYKLTLSNLVTCGGGAPYILRKAVCGCERGVANGVAAVNRRRFCAFSSGFLRWRGRCHPCLQHEIRCAAGRQFRAFQRREVKFSFGVTAFSRGRELPSNRLRTAKFCGRIKKGGLL